MLIMEGNLLKELNSDQVKAVSHGEGPLLVLAGPGSGKTRVATYRIAYLIKNMGVPPHEILALTFTRKAAGEMRKRVGELLGAEMGKIWIGTFHSICLRILRKEVGFLENYAKDFLILSDLEEQKGFIRKCMREFDFGRSHPSIFAKDVLEMFNEAENSGEVVFENNSLGQDLNILYDCYKKELAEANFMTFNDLLLVTNKLLRENKEILCQYQKRFSHVLVDEYQDVNIHQDRFVKLLSDLHRNLFVVGDEDQLIYGWRGADTRNILNFEKDFVCQKLVNLNRNYRSTETILGIATEIIKKNSLRKEKTLWTQNPCGERAVVFRGRDDNEEGYFVANMISELTLSSNITFGQVAVLYRANYQSRAIENALRRKGIQYVVKKGVGFYQREEIKDMLAYLQLIQNPRDQASFERIINVPHRGIKKIEIERLREVSEASGLGPLEAIEECEKGRLLPSRTLEKLAKFLDIINSLRSEARENSALQVINRIVNLSGYRDYLGKDVDRIENVEELLKAAGEDGEPSVFDFLDSVSLATDEDRVSGVGENVSLMTIHAAKGLEFPVVFLVGVNEETLPHKKSSSTQKGIEEERRLFYVAITRAEKMLCLSCCSPSPFLRDIPPERAVYVRYGGLVDENTSSFKTTPEVENAGAGLTSDRRVSHKFFGRGMLRKVENTGQNIRIYVVFPSFGGKSIVAVFSSTSGSPSFPLCEIKEEANVNAENKDRDTHLHDASLAGDKEEVFSLIEQGSDVNTEDEDGNTALHFASLEGGTEVASFLVEKGANVNARNKNGDTPLHFATRAGETKTASFLIEQGTDVNAEDEDGDTPLHDALSQGMIQLAALLIEKGANVNAKNKDGHTPLRFDSLEDFAKAASFLVEQGVDVNTED